MVSIACNKENMIPKNDKIFKDRNYVSFLLNIVLSAAIFGMRWLLKKVIELNGLQNNEHSFQ